MKPIEPGCLAVIIATARCGEASGYRKPGPKAGTGMVVEVVSLSTERGCQCCVSVMPTWIDIGDPRGVICRRSNLMRIDGHEETEEEHEATNTIQEALG